MHMNNILKASFAFHNLAHHAEVIPVLPHFERPVGTFDTLRDRAWRTGGARTDSLSATVSGSREAAIRRKAVGLPANGAKNERSLYR